jgi:hypothetical protein
MVTVEIHAVAAYRRSSVGLPKGLSGNAWTVYIQIKIIASRGHNLSQQDPPSRVSKSKHSIEAQ